MLNHKYETELSQIVAVIYFSNNVDAGALKKLKKFLNDKAVGHHRWGKLHRYLKVEMDEVSDLNAVLKKFPKLYEGYKDLSDCPERPD